MIDSFTSQILDLGLEMTGAKLLAVYQAEGQDPVLKLYAGSGDDHILPATLPAQELALLKHPELWVLGKRPTSALHRAARAANLAYLASAPLGQPNASIGLVVFAGEPPVGTQTIPSPAAFTNAAQLLAIAITLDIQQHSQQMQSQMKQELLHSQLITADAIEEHTSEGIFLLSPTLHIQRMNTSAEMILGYTNREIKGQHVENVLIEADRNQPGESLSPALLAAQGGSIAYNLANVHLYRRDGEDFLAQMRIYPVLDQDQIVQILVFFQDLSEREQIRQQAQQLEQRALLGEVTAVFAHEVRNPINNISTGLQLLAMNLPEQDANQSSIAGMLQDCDRLAELMKSVLSFSRPTEYALEPIDLAVLLRRLMERLHPRITHLNVQYNLHVEPGCPAVLGNLRALEQVFNNLINNALQAMSETGGRLVIKVQPLRSAENHNFVEVSVADTGPGIPEEVRQRLFQPFFTTEHNGTGLGLAITKRIITAHKGNIRLESFAGGTVFYVQLPAEKSVN
jgi:two-component system sensor histidine kinase AtoS